jgi:hypothetical protein
LIEIDDHRAAVQVVKSAIGIVIKQTNRRFPQSTA